MWNSDMCTDTKSHLSLLHQHHQVKGKKGWVGLLPRSEEGNTQREEYGFPRLEDSTAKGRAFSWLSGREEKSIFLTEGMV